MAGQSFAQRWEDCGLHVYGVLRSPACSVCFAGIIKHIGKPSIGHPAMGCDPWQFCCTVRVHEELEANQVFERMLPYDLRSKKPMKPLSHSNCPWGYSQGWVFHSAQALIPLAKSIRCEVGSMKHVESPSHSHAFAGSHPCPAASWGWLGRLVLVTQLCQEC